MNTLLKSLSLSIKKLPAMAGGYVSLMLSLLIAFLMFLTAHRALGTKAPTALSIAYVDNDGSEVSKELISAIKLANDGSVRLIKYDSMASAQAAIDSGEAEGILVNSKDVAENLKNSDPALEYYPAKGASSAQAARELIAGETVTLASRLHAEVYFEKLTGRAPTESERDSLSMIYSQRMTNEGSAVEKTTVYSVSSAEAERETDLFSAFYARYSGFSAFVIMLILLMLGAFSGSKDEKNALERIASLKNGKRMGRLSNLFSLMMTGIVLLALSFIPSGGVSLLQIASGCAYVFCASALALLIGTLSGSARAELTSPLIAFLTSLAGGCFTDPYALGVGFKTLSLFTPQGQYLAALNGKLLFVFALAAIGFTLLFLSHLLDFAAKKAVQAR